MILSLSFLWLFRHPLPPHSTVLHRLRCSSMIWLLGRWRRFRFSWLSLLLRLLLLLLFAPHRPTLLPKQRTRFLLVLLPRRRGRLLPPPLPVGEYPRFHRSVGRPSRFPPLRGDPSPPHLLRFRLSHLPWSRFGDPVANGVTGTYVTPLSHRFPRFLPLSGPLRSKQRLPRPLEALSAPPALGMPLGFLRSLVCHHRLPNPLARRWPPLMGSLSRRTVPSAKFHSPLVVGSLFPVLI